MQGTGLGRSFLKGEHEGLFDHALILLKELGVDRQTMDESMAVDRHADRAATMGHLQPFGRKLLLRLGDATLHLLGLFEEFAYACHNAGQGL